MEKLIKVKFYKECIPKKGIWYDHSDTLFISVMRKSNPYIRRKSIPTDNKKDNELSDWHRIWQYEKIEKIYGVEKYGVKSYEITINIDGENHRIDSVIENIGIEFQHTLSVDLEEMNLRFNAHSKFGFTPYLMIDLTKFSTSEFDIALQSKKRNPLKTKLLKWLDSKHSLSNNLFIDFKDGIFRIVPTIKKGYIKIEKEYFLNNILKLENDLIQEIENNEILVKKELEKEKLEKEKERLNLLKIQKEKKREAETKKIKELEREKYYYYRDVSVNPDFKFFKLCFKNSIIKPYVLPYKNDIFIYHTDKDIENGILEKNHNYFSKYGDTSILYRTVTEILENEYKYLWAEIIIKEKHKIIAEFKWEKGKNVIKKQSVKDENLPF
ncbi:hypothetical protein [Psychroserpens damuponensis]|uniref:hypothetical protein n=1 Tax=Psychroserpens damuponensis TaxID=943936 RepID=UPI00058AE5C0|nr:hypothetical protein [Psychroserpens damuponensis]